jgi:hypothetical protein
LWLWKLKDIVIGGPSDFLDEDYNIEIAYADNDDWTITIGVAMLLSRLIDFLDRPYMSQHRPADSGQRGPTERILDGFEKTIALVYEEISKYSKQEGVDEIDIEMESECLHRINDVQDELAMITRVLRQQEDVWRQFSANTWPDLWPGGPDGRMEPPYTILRRLDPTQRERWHVILRPYTQFRDYEKRIAQLNEDTVRIEQAIHTKLDLKTKDATLKETHATAMMSAAVFGFTIITIIFTPLSFVVALFALPIDQLQRAQIQSRWTDEAGMFTKSYIGKWVGKSVQSVYSSFM